MLSEGIIKDFGLKSKFKIWFKIFIGFISCAVFLVLLVCSTPVYIFRLLAIQVAKWFRPDLGEILNALSSILSNDLFSGKVPRCTLVVPMTLQGHWTLEELREIILERWIKARDKNNGELIYQKFCQYPYRWLGFTFWKQDENFDLNHHIHYHENSFEIVYSEKLNELVESLLNEPYKPSKSPWEFHYLANFRNTQDTARYYTSDVPTFALVLKIHHSLADGFSLLSAIVEGLGGQSLENMKLPSPAKSPKLTLLEQIIFFLTFPIKLFSEVLGKSFPKSYQRYPWLISDKRKAWWQLYGKSQLIPIWQVKDIKNAFGVTFTSVLLSAISSGIHQDLEKRRKSIKESYNGHMPCVSVLPVPGHNRRLTNHATSALLSLPTTSFSDPGSRLKACDVLLRNGKNSVVPYFVRFLQAAIGCHLYRVCHAFSKNHMISTGLTNFPGLPIKIGIGNAKGISVDFAAGALEGNAGNICLIKFGF
ncbi:hypothetical protein Ocin01_08879 [Orchesella cincta]|uniref:Diacylglycerol O-acyltransferase n=1 Tax=Orchesella cincta TaxID=48709 RepID=A0A1D2MYS0_ORCCI|nr:hypothetical protein Ocin01_08879 [Orchesella cincta]